MNTDLTPVLREVYPLWSRLSDAPALISLLMISLIAVIDSAISYNQKPLGKSLYQCIRDGVITGFFSTVLLALAVSVVGSPALFVLSHSSATPVRRSATLDQVGAILCDPSVTRTVNAKGRYVFSVEVPATQEIRAGVTFTTPSQTRSVILSPRQMQRLEDALTAFGLKLPGKG